MPSFNLVEDSTGKLISQSALPITNIKSGYVVVETADNSGTWNETTRGYDPIQLHRVVTLKNFIFRFTDAEREALHVKVKTNEKAEEFVQTLKIIQSVDLDSGYIVGRVNLMETAGVIGTGRATEILS